MELATAINASDMSSRSAAYCTFTLNMRGAKSETGTATLQFCPGLTIVGIGADVRAQADLQATLTRFASIKRAIILAKGGAYLASRGPAALGLYAYRRRWLLESRDRGRLRAGACDQERSG